MCVCVFVYVVILHNIICWNAFPSFQLKCLFHWIMVSYAFARRVWAMAFVKSIRDFSGVKYQVLNICFSLSLSLSFSLLISIQMVYGGKVLDNFDRRTLFAYLDEYLGDFLFDSFQPFHFYKGNDHEHYSIPYAASTKADFLGKFLFLLLLHRS